MSGIQLNQLIAHSQEESEVATASDDAELEEDDG